MRGEDWLDLASPAHVSGSPPHARGRPSGWVWGIGAGGITPACAGKTTCLNSWTSKAWDHPRMRGEDDELVAPDVSPSWITPACAGKT